MDTENPAAGYLVKIRHWEQPDQNQTKLFFAADLLTARQAAFRHAQQLVSQKPPTEVLDIAIYLTEVENNEPYAPYIAQVFNRRFHRSQIVPEPDAFTIELTLEAGTIDEYAEQTLELTLDLTRTDEAFETAHAVKKGLAELICEYEFYLSYGHPPGFGFLLLIIAGPGEREIVKEAVLFDTDEDIYRLQEKLTKPFQMQAYWLLFDALAYAASLIGDYNQTYAAPDEYLAFSTEARPAY